MQPDSWRKLFKEGLKACCILLFGLIALVDNTLQEVIGTKVDEAKMLATALQLIFIASEY